MDSYFRPDFPPSFPANLAHPLIWTQWSGTQPDDTKPRLYAVAIPPKFRERSDIWIIASQDVKRQPWGMTLDPPIAQIFHIFGCHIMAADIVEEDGSIAEDIAHSARVPILQEYYDAVDQMLGWDDHAFPNAEHVHLTGNRMLFRSC